MATPYDLVTRSSLEANIERIEVVYVAGATFDDISRYLTFVRENILEDDVNTVLSNSRQSGAVKKLEKEHYIYKLCYN